MGGATQTVGRGDFLAMVYPDDHTGIYLMPREAVDTMDVVDTVDPLNQEDMLARFKKRIKDKGKLMVLTGAALIRQAEPSECISALRNPCMPSLSHRGAKSTTSFTNTTKTDQAFLLGVQMGLAHMWLVRQCPGGKASKESRIIKDKEYRDVWEKVNDDSCLDSSSALNNLLVSQGFSVHKPKPKRFIWTYQLTGDDIKGMPTPIIITPAGGRQKLIEGDTLEIPAGAEEAMSIIVQTKLDASMYSEAKEEHRRSLLG